MDDAISDMDVLQTRHTAYDKTNVMETIRHHTSQISMRKSIVFKCKDHVSDDSLFNSQCVRCYKFVKTYELNKTVLPRVRDVLNLLITYNQLAHEKIIRYPIKECSQIISEIWIGCNVYPQELLKTERKLEQLYKSYRALGKFSKQTTGFWNACEPFQNSLSELFDVVASDEYRKYMENVWKLKMTTADKKFYENQKFNPPIGYCERKIDSRWKKTEDRKEERGQRSRNESYADSSFQGESFCDDDDDNEDHMVIDSNVNFSRDSDNDYQPNQDDSPGPSGNKKKRSYYTAVEDKNDDMPSKYRHVRNGMCSVRPEIYTTISHLESVYHLSHRQAQAAIVTVANNLFGREEFGEWKMFTAKEKFDNNTLPAPNNIRRTESYLEALALNCVVEEMMTGDDESCVVYSNDGSAQSGVGSYVVQSFTVNGKPRALPTFAVFTESRETLAELVDCTLDILVASSGHRYKKDELISKVDFVMTDSTSHNLNVIEKVCEDLNVEDVPDTLLCNVHPLMLFQRKIKELLQQIHDQLGKQKLSDSFLVDVDFKNESFVVKAIKCLSNFINKDYSAKPWNRCSHFEEFIKPRKNFSLSLKDHRFNRLQDCALSVLHHLQDINDYLDKYPNITNGVAILDRTFVEMDILKPILATIGLLGIHITRPFHTLVTHPETNYTVLIDSFKQLYSDLQIPAAEYMTVDKVAAFVPIEMYETSLPDEELVGSIKSAMRDFHADIVILLQIALKMFADGFCYQKGNIFGFGPSAQDDCGTVLKLSEVDDSKLEMMNKYVSTHNLISERLVGETNYGLHIRGKANLSSVSKKMVINKCADLISAKPVDEFMKFRKPAKEIHNIRTNWNAKMQVLQQQGYDEQNLKNMHQEKTKFTDLEFLKDRKGPFTKKEEVDDYMMSAAGEKEKLERMYREVRYARMTSQTLPISSSLFRLRRGGKYLLAEEYAVNLSQYLDDSHSMTSISMTDLHNVILKVQEQTIATTTPEQPSQPVVTQPHVDKSETTAESSFNVHGLKEGEFVAVFWDEGTKRVWYLGTVESISSGTISVNHFKCTSKSYQTWVAFDEEEQDVAVVRPEQIIASNLNVRFPLSSGRLKILLDAGDVKLINDRLPTC